MTFEALVGFSSANISVKFFGFNTFRVQADWCERLRHLASWRLLRNEPVARTAWSTTFPAARPPSWRPRAPLLRAARAGKTVEWSGAAGRRVGKAKASEAVARMRAGEEAGPEPALAARSLLARAEAAEDCLATPRGASVAASPGVPLRAVGPGPRGRLAEIPAAAHPVSVADLLKKLLQEVPPDPPGETPRRRARARDPPEHSEVTPPIDPVGPRDPQVLEEVVRPARGRASAPLVVAMARSLANLGVAALVVSFPAEDKLWTWVVE